MRKLLLDIQKKYADNWDGAGAKQPNDLTLRRANVALDILEELKIEPTKVVPSVESGIGVCFTDANGRYADLEFFNNGDACVAMFVNGEEFLIENIVPRDEPFKRRHLVREISRINLFMHGLLDPLSAEKAA